jgi:hypothetical protein
MPHIKDPTNSKLKIARTTKYTLSDNPELDFVRKIANSAVEGSDLIQKRFPIYHRNAISRYWFSKT